MAAAAVLPAPHDVPTELNYYSPIGSEAPFQYVYDPPEGTEKHNIGTDPHPVTIRDARGNEKKYNLSLDTSGFQFVEYPTTVTDFTDEETITNVYYKEVEEILKKVAGAKRVFIFDHTIRYALTIFALLRSLHDVRIVVANPAQIQHLVNYCAGRWYVRN